MEAAEVNVTKEGTQDHLPIAKTGWISCEFDMEWVSEDEDMDAAWIVKDETGKVLEHSRRAFVSVKTREETKLKLWLRVLESMRSLKKKKVIFVSAFGDFVEAIKKPTLWPALLFEASEINRELKAFEA
ncbi:hypothetical protein Bca4012_017144 [Brassica carinata]